MTPVTLSQFYTNITATTTISSSNGGLYGIFVASSTAGTLKISDGTTTIVNTFTPLAATFYQIPATFNTSLVITVGGTIDCTVFWTK